MTKCKYVLLDISYTAQLKYRFQNDTKFNCTNVIVSVKIIGMTEQRVVISVTCDLCRIVLQKYCIQISEI